MKKGILLIALVLLLVIGEFILRNVFGFTDTVLVQEDSQLEYLARPNQERQRFGNNLKYNEYSMRSDSLNKSALKILGLGDSVINGGNMIDQEELATTLLSKKLSREIGKDVQVLNISYKSWGPDNTLAYLNKFGSFDADLIFLVISSHDAHDVMSFQKIVGRDVNYPEKQYSLAYFELVERYLLPRFHNIFKKKTDNPIEKEKKIFNPGLEGLVKYAENLKIPLFIYLHPEIKEIKKAQYHKSGQSILDFAAQNHIFIKKGILRAREEHYQDNIHLNSKGQYYLYRELLPEIEKFLKNSNEKELPKQFVYKE